MSFEMIGIRHFLHPIRTTRLIGHMASVYLYRAFHGRELDHVGRDTVTQCWCGGSLGPFKWHHSYGVCMNCGTYVNRRPPRDEELARIYSFDYYWHTRQKLRGNPSIEGRPENDRSDGRVEFWLKLIERQCARTGRVIEIGCGSGVLLKELKRCGYECIGVDIDEKSADWIRQNMGLDIRSGIFPNIDLPACDVFLAFDVIEHSKRPLEFLKRAAELLSPGGIAIIQAPIDRNGDRPPFAKRFQDAFDDLEHLFIFTDKAMQILAERSGLEVVTLNEAVWLMGELAVFRKPCR
jgi:SAM-dependent methyltransferase